MLRQLVLGPAMRATMSRPTMVAARNMSGQKIQEESDYRFGELVQLLFLFSPHERIL